MLSTDGTVSFPFHETSMYENPGLRLVIELSTENSRQQSLRRFLSISQRSSPVWMLTFLLPSDNDGHKKFLENWHVWSMIHI